MLEKDVNTDLSGLLSTYLGKQLQWHNEHNRQSKVQIYGQTSPYITLHYNWFEIETFPFKIGSQC